ncbi:fatty acyl-AMP ligase [Oscillatoria sp. FACHB-1407]|uniref:fatty acyl-AMP ligase n=1 Tax=Oscillatoria sp. FACHB-1407 TaxID=2692847 RepID=UPI00168917BD|nr:fatty acyl-AMP ligase [Oscillatoria sp. FACHB-1407]MBD2464426.1 fatty acyl-AMP ligase [Oscillatoria sp. FACHB-1407]
MTICLTHSTSAKREFLTLIDLLSYRAQSQPHQLSYTFLEDGELEASKLDYQTLDCRARAIASQLQKLNAIGQRALLLYPPGLDFIAAFFGCLYAGVVAVPAYPARRNQSLSRLQAIVADAQAAIALTTTALLKDIEERFAEEPTLSGLRWVTTDDVSDEVASEWQKPNINSVTLAFLQYTSGSTGTPKGVMVSHSNLLHNSLQIYKSFADTPESQGVSWLPPYHDMGLIGGILQPLYVGAPMALMAPMAFLQKPIRWLKAISHFKATTSGGPNFAYDLCVRKVTPEQLAELDLSSWKVAFTGAEPVRAETLEQFAAKFEPCGFRREAFHPCYGMAETTLIVSGSFRNVLPVLKQIDGTALERNRVVTATKKHEMTRTVVGCGQCLGQTVVVANPDTSTRCSAEQIGEIWVSSPSVAKGYWNRPEQTEQTFSAYLADTGEGPFLRTGDLGFLQDGELFITGRIKDLMIIRGQNHYPQDIELTAEKSHPALRPGCGAAFTVDIKGEERLVLVYEVERSYLRKLNIKEVIGNINQAIAAQHGLQIYSTTLVKPGSIPKTSSGKIQRHACRTGFLTGQLSVVEDWSESPLGKAKFLHLQTDIGSLLQELTAGKQL